MESERNIRIVARLDEQLDAARCGKMDGWIHYFGLNGIMDCYKLKDPSCGMVYTAYVYADGYVKIIDDRLANHTSAAYVTADRMYRSRVIA